MSTPLAATSSGSYSVAPSTRLSMSWEVNAVHWLAAMTPVRRTPTNSITSR